VSRDRVLVTGGAGYIGSHVAQALARSGLEPIIFDNLSLGHREAVARFKLVKGDLEDRAALAAVLDDHRLVAVVHMAAYAYVGESVQQPAKYYRNNVVGTLNLLEAMRARGLTHLVASSSCTTYGHPLYLPIDERHPQQPVSPYGRSKLALEDMVRDFARAYGTRYVLFRYFNAAGASDLLGEDHNPETHLIPLVLQVALGQLPHVTIHGDDYPTPDGTCVRDYVHVEDLAAAHVTAVQRLLDGAEPAAYNLGTERGYSVREVVEVARRVTGHSIPVQYGPRRAGDPPVLVASARLARADLGWSAPNSGLEHIIETAWRWHRHHPLGYAAWPAPRLRVAS